MNTPDDDELSTSERQALQRLAADRPPASALEDRVVQSLRSQGLLRKRSQPATTLLAFAAGVILFVAGAFVGRNWPVAMPPVDSRPQFVLMLYEDSKYQVASAAELPGRVAEYGRWAQSLGSQNYIRGQKLVQQESTVSDTGIVGPGEPVPQKGSVAGYFVIRASDASEAARIAATCPHVRYGGFISVREVER